MVSIASGVFAQFGAARWRSPDRHFGRCGSIDPLDVVTRFHPWNDGSRDTRSSAWRSSTPTFNCPSWSSSITPAQEGLRPMWRKAASELGANSWHYWRYVGGPLIFPSV